jgi:hypothetical protein
MDPSKFLDWWSALLGAIGGAFAAILSFWGMFNGRIRRLEEASKACMIHQGAQAEQHKANLQQLVDIKTGNAQILRILLEEKQRG